MKSNILRTISCSIFSIRRRVIGETMLNIIVKTAFAVVVGLYSFQVNAADFFMYQGAETRASGGAGSIASRGGTAALHNPANLTTSKKMTYDIDVGLANIDFALIPPADQAAPGKIDVPLAPFYSLGASHSLSLFKKKFYLGYFFIPVGFPGVSTSNKSVPSPNPVNNQYVTVDTEVETFTYRLGSGIAYRLTKQIDIGASIQFVSEDFSTIATNESFIGPQNISYSSTYMQYLFGANYRFKHAKVYFTYQYLSTPMYQLNIDLGGGGTSREVQDYRPTIYTLGVKYRYKQYIPFAQLSREEWGAGTENGQPPLSAISGILPTEFQTTNNLVFGLKYKLKKSTYATASFAILPSNKGSGVVDDNGNVVLVGYRPEDFQGLDRQNLSLGYEFKYSKKRRITSHFNYMTGEKSSPINTPSAGDYKLRIIMIGAGTRFR